VFQLNLYKLVLTWQSSPIKSSSTHRECSAFLLSNRKLPNINF
jgi:hypothetical protein